VFQFAPTKQVFRLWAVTALPEELLNHFLLLFSSFYSSSFSFFSYRLQQFPLPFPILILRLMVLAVFVFAIRE